MALYVEKQDVFHHGSESHSSENIDEVKEFKAPVTQNEMVMSMDHIVNIQKPSNLGIPVQPHGNSILEHDTTGSMDVKKETQSLSIDQHQAINTRIDSNEPASSNGREGSSVLVATTNASTIATEASTPAPTVAASSSNATSTAAVNASGNDNNRLSKSNKSKTKGTGVSFAAGTNNDKKQKSKSIKFGFGFKTLAGLMGSKSSDNDQSNSNSQSPGDGNDDNEQSIFQQEQGKRPSQAPRASKSTRKSLRERFTFTRRKTLQAAGEPSPDDDMDDADAELLKLAKGRRERGASIFALSGAQQAFLPVCVRHLLSSTTTAIKVPQLFKDQGVVLFADISGFTALGKKLRSVKGTTQIEAAEQLAKRINDVLRRLTTECQNFGGDVAKFAGDALLCYWISENNMDSQIEKAKNCAISMLHAVKEVDSELDVHGGIASGGLMHVHLGDSRSDKLRWYLITGEAVVAATNLVDKAERGTFIYQAKEIPEVTTDANSEANANGENDSSMIRRTGSKSRQPNANPRAPLRLEVITKESEAHHGRDRTESQLIDPKSNLANPHGIAYIPELLKSTLQFGIDVPEMRRRVAVVFAMLPDLTATNAEIRSQNISHSRLSELNDSFNTLVAISHKFDGEVRDLLFDDKGCVFIGVFGAHKAIEMPELKAAKAAMSMLEELDNIKVGVSVGTCFVGMCGNESRHDFVVMGHEVNMAARFMSKASIGSVLVSHTIKEQTEELFDYKEVTVMLQKKINEHTHDLDGYVAKELAKQATISDLRASSLAGKSPPNSPAFSTNGASPGLGVVAEIPTNNQQTSRRKKNKQDLNPSVNDPNGKCLAYTPDKEIRRRPSFIAQYRYAHLEGEIFVGREKKLKTLEAHVSKMYKDKTSGSVLIYSPAGMGKTALVRNFRKQNSEKYNIVLGATFALELDTRFYVLRQIIESEFNIYEGMSNQRAKSTFKTWEQGGLSINWDTMEMILPYIKSYLVDDTPQPTPQRRSSENNKRGLFTRLPSIKGTKRESTLNAASAASSAEKHESIKDNIIPGISLISTGTTSNVPESPSMSSQTSNRKSGLGRTGLGGSVRNLFGGGSSSSSSNNPGNRNSRDIEGTAGDSSAASTSAPMSRTRGRKGTLNKGDKDEAAIAAAKVAHEEKMKQKIQKRKSRGPDTGNILSTAKITSILELLMGLLKIAHKAAVAAGKKGYVMVFEDLQWMDIPSLQVLEELQKLIMNDKMLPGVTIIITSRPMIKQDTADPQSLLTQNTLRTLLIESLFEMSSGKNQQGKATNFMSMNLRPLSKASVTDYINAMLIQAPGESVSKGLIDTVFSKTDGFPLNLVVTMNSLFDNDGIVREPNGLKRLKNQRVDDLLLQNKENGAFIAKFDALPQDVRNILKIASCLGERFKSSDLQKIYAKDVEMKNKDAGIDPRSQKEKPADEREIIRMLEIAAREDILKKMRRSEWTWTHFGIQNNIQDLLPVERKNEVQKIFKSISEFVDSDAADVLSRLSTVDF